MRDSEDKSSDATLSNLTVDGEAVEGFAAETLEYNIELAEGTTEVPVVVATVTATDKANAVVTDATELPGTTTIVVTAEDGTTTKTYKINFTVATPDPVKSSDATLSNLTVDGEAVEGFAAETLEYNVELAEGTTEVPVVVATVTATDKANAVVTDATELPGTTTIVVTAEDGTTTKTYKINFTVAVDPTAGATAELAKITDEKVTTVPYGTENTKEAIEAAMLELANAAVADGYTVTIVEEPVSTYNTETKAWVGKFVVTNNETAANTKADAENRSITVVIAAASTDATLTSTIGTVDNSAETIVDIPKETTLADFKAAITPAAGATLKVTDADDVEIAEDTTALATGQKVVVTAEDGTTIKTYTITLAE